MTVTEATMVAVGGDLPYDVHIGPAVIQPENLAIPGVTRAAVIVPESLQALGKPVIAALDDVGVDTLELSIPDGERAKDLAVVEGLWAEFGRANLTRSDLVVGVGGGAATDVAGFAASTWLRGIRWVALPTSLLAMVDAAVGGKTGINTTSGKNLVGSFHPPDRVLCDLNFLATLPADQWTNGMAEVVKCGFIADPVILELAADASARAPSSTIARELIERSVRVKADIVGRDLKESGPREFLNYGHTLGHALELVEGFRLPHGHAISIGMVFAAELARAADQLDDETVARHGSVLAEIGLPTAYPGAAAWPTVLEVMSRDKKARGAVLRFVVLQGVGNPRILASPSPEWLEAAWHAVTRG